MNEKLRNTISNSYEHLTNEILLLWHEKLQWSQFGNRGLIRLQIQTGCMSSLHLWLTTIICCLDIVYDNVYETFLCDDEGCLLHPSNYFRTFTLIKRTICYSLRCSCYIEGSYYQKQFCKATILLFTYFYTVFYYLCLPNRLFVLCHFISFFPILLHERLITWEAY